MFLKLELLKFKRKISVVALCLFMLLVVGLQTFIAMKTPELETNVFYIASLEWFSGIIFQRWLPCLLRYLFMQIRNIRVYKILC